MTKSGILHTIITWVMDRIFAPIYRAWLWLRTWALVLKPCRFPLLMVLAGAVFLIMVPQGQDLLRGLAERIAGTSTDNWLRFFFIVSALLWTVSSWYWSRVMLYLEFPGVPGNDPGLHAFRMQAPRFIGCAAGASVAAALFKASFGYENLSDPARRLLLLYALVSLVGAVVFFYVITKRRDWTLAAYNRLQSVSLLQGRFATPVVGLLAVTPGSNLKYGTLRLRDLPRGVKLTAGATLAIMAVLFLLFVFALQATAPVIGAAAILLFAVAGWMAAGSVLDFVGMRLQFPVISTLFVFTIVFSFWNDNHAVRTLPEPPNSLTSRPTVSAALGAWYQRQLQRPSPDGTYPLFVVSAEGGGIRAAFWTATVLAEIQDRNPCFADQLFAISGISGGSLGSTVFIAQLADSRATMNGFRCDTHGGPASGTKPLKKTAQNVLGENFLAPVVAALLYPDLVQRMLPFPVGSFDRARALEGAWERAWSRYAGNNRFAEPFDNLWRDRPDAWMPALFLNSTWVETGKRLIISNLAVTSAEFNDAEDVNRFYDKYALPLSTAAHLSARFTYVSPAGTLKKDGETYGRAVDGGYFENSGTTTEMEVLQTLDQLAEDNPAWKKVRPVVIHISNEPVDPAYSTVHLATAPKDKATAPLAGLNEILSPPITLLNARNARAMYARETIKWHVGEENFLHFGLCKNKMGIPLGWVLSDAVQTEMEKQLTHNGCAVFDNAGHIDAIDKLLKARYARAVRTN